MDDLDHLIDAVLDGRASADEHAALTERRSADANARRQWWAESALPSHLRQ